MYFYFYVSPFKSWETGNSRYQHEIIVLAEGLTALGHQCFGNFDYWPLDSSRNTFLITFADEQSAYKADAVVVSGMYYGNNGFKLSHHIVALAGKVPLIFTDLFDGFYTPSFSKDMRIFDLVLKCHFNAHYNNPPNVVPWAFGITNRYLNYIQNPAFDTRQRSVLWNFRINHDVRQRALHEVKPLLSKYFAINDTLEEKDTLLTMDAEQRFWWEQSGQRHSENYFQRLSEAQVVACFGGGLIGSRKTTSLFDRIYRKVLDPVFNGTPKTIYQWDSYRFWETLTSGAIPLMYNLYDLGARFPVNPDANVHYWSLDLFSPAASINDIAQEPDKLCQIAANGREWAIKNYSPVPTAVRFLNLLSQLLSRDTK